jgi:hypothetical protein
MALLTGYTAPSVVHRERLDTVLEVADEAAAVISGGVRGNYPQLTAGHCDDNAPGNAQTGQDQGKSPYTPSALD